MSFRQQKDYSRSTSDSGSRKPAVVDVFQLTFEDQWKMKPLSSINANSSPQKGILESPLNGDSLNPSPYSNANGQVLQQDMKDVKKNTSVTRERPGKKNKSGSIQKSNASGLMLSDKSLLNHPSPAPPCLPDEKILSQSMLLHCPSPSISQESFILEEASKLTVHEALQESAKDVSDNILDNTIFSRIHSMHKAESKHQDARKIDIRAQSAPHDMKSSETRTVSKVRIDLSKRLDRLAIKALGFADEAREDFQEMKSEEETPVVHSNETCNVSSKKVGEEFKSEDRLDSTTEEFLNFPPEKSEDFEIGLERRMSVSAMGFRPKQSHSGKVLPEIELSRNLTASAKNLMSILEDKPSTRTGDLPVAPNHRKGALLFNKSSSNMKELGHGLSPKMASLNHSLTIQRPHRAPLPSIDSTDMAKAESERSATESAALCEALDVKEDHLPDEFELGSQLNPDKESDQIEPSPLIAVAATTLSATMRVTKRKSIDTSMLRNSRYAGGTSPNFKGNPNILNVSGIPGHHGRMGGSHFGGPKSQAIGALIRPIEEEEEETWDEEEERLTKLAIKLSRTSEKYWYEDHMRQERSENTMAKLRKAPWYHFTKNKTLDSRIKNDSEYVKRRILDMNSATDPRSTLQKAAPANSMKSSSGSMASLMGNVYGSPIMQEGTGKDPQSQGFIKLEDEALNIYRDFVKFRATRKGHMYKATTVGKSLSGAEETVTQTRHNRMGSTRRKYSYRLALRKIREKINKENERLGLPLIPSDDENDLQEEDKLDKYLAEEYEDSTEAEKISVSHTAGDDEDSSDDTSENDVESDTEEDIAAQPEDKDGDAHEENEPTKSHANQESDSCSTPQSSPKDSKDAPRLLFRDD